MSVNLTNRDTEILRTLCRVQLATSKAFQGAFFSTTHLASKRLAILRGAGFILPHTKGLPPSNGMRRINYWRLTPNGLSTVEDCFPSERIPNNLVARARRASLMFASRRDLITDFYIGITLAKEGDINKFSERASRIVWRGQHEVVLTYTKLVALNRVSKRIVPDATLSTAHTDYFIEFEKRSESKKKIREKIQGYKAAFKDPGFRRLFPEELKHCVLLATETTTRARKVTSVIEKLSLPFAAYALTRNDAKSFLRDAMSNDQGRPPAERSPDKSRRLLMSLYESSKRHASECSEDIKDTPMAALLYEVYDHLVATEGL